MRLSVRLFGFGLGVAALVIACTSETTVTSSGGGFSSSGSIPTAIPPSTEGAPPKGTDRCPSSPPVDNASCVGSTGTCDYGADLRDVCNLQAYCNGSRWRVTEPSCQVACPASRVDIVPGTVCDDAEMTCSFIEGTCGCVGPKTDAGAPSDAGSDGGTDSGVPLRKGIWACAPPPSGESLCPLAAPKSGTTCVKSVTCDYGSCALDRELTFVCSGHVWSKTLPMDKCPP